MSEHVRVERDGGVLAITLARPERRNAITVAMYAALAEAIEGAARTIASGSSRSAAKARISPPATILPISSTRCRETAKRSRCGASCARSQHANSARRRGPRQLRRHRHDHAAALRPCDRGRRRALLDAVRRLGAGPGSSEFAAAPGASRAAPCRALPAAREPFGVDEALAIGLVSHRAAAGALHRSSTNWSRASGETARGAPADTRPASAAPARGDPRTDEAGEHAICRTARVRRSEGSDQRLLRRSGTRRRAISWRNKRLSSA